MKKLLFIMLISAFFIGCSSHTEDQLKKENEELKAQNRNLRKLLEQLRQNTNRNQLRNSIKKKPMLRK